MKITQLVENEEIFSVEEKQFIIDLIFFITQTESYEKLFQGKTLFSLLTNIQIPSDHKIIRPSSQTGFNGQGIWINIFNLIYNFFINNNCLLLIKPFDFNVILCHKHVKSPYKELIMACFLTLSCVYINRSSNAEMFQKLESFQNNLEYLTFSKFVEKKFHTTQICIGSIENCLLPIPTIHDLMNIIGNILVERNNCILHLFDMKYAKQSKSDVKSLECKIFELERMISKLQSKNKEMTEELKNTQSALETSKTLISKYSLKIESIKSEKDSLIQNNKECQKKLSDISKNHEINKLELKNKIRDNQLLEDQSHNLNKKIIDLENLITKKDSELKKLSLIPSKSNDNNISSPKQLEEQLIYDQTEQNTKRYHDMEMENMKLIIENKFLLEQIKFLKEENKNNRSIIDKAFEHRATSSHNQITERNIEKKIDHISQETNHLRRALEEKENMKSNRRKSIGSFFSLSKKKVNNDRRKTLPYNFYNIENNIQRDSSLHSSNDESREKIFEQYIDPPKSNIHANEKDNIKYKIIKESNKL